MLNLLDKLKKDQVMAPYVWDNMSCASAKTGGAEVAVVSEASVSRWAVGYPDCGLLTADDMVRATDYIKGNIDICLCVEARDCYGETPVHAYRTCERLIKAGADAVIIDDSTDWKSNKKDDGSIRLEGKMKDIPVERRIWLAKLKAAIEASKEFGPKFTIVARTNALAFYGLEEAITRCQLATELGIPVTCIRGLSSIEEARLFASKVSGIKMWDCLTSHDGISEVEVLELEELNYKLVTAHILEKAAIAGMIDFGKHAYNEKSLIYHDTHMLGMKKEDMVQGVLGMVPKKFTPRPDRYVSREPDFWKDLPGENK